MYVNHETKNKIKSAKRRKHAVILFQKSLENELNKICFSNSVSKRPQHPISTACPLHHFAPHSRYMAPIAMATRAQCIQHECRQGKTGCFKITFFSLIDKHRKNCARKAGGSFEAVYETSDQEAA